MCVPEAFAYRGGGEHKVRPNMLDQFFKKRVSGHIFNQQYFIF